MYHGLLFAETQIILKGGKMSKRHDLLKKILMIMTVLFMVVALIPASAGQTLFAEEEENEEEEKVPDLYKTMTGMADNTPSDWSSDKDPYGYGLNKAFFMNTQQELLTYQYNGHSDKTVESYDILKSENDEYPLNGYKSMEKYNIDKSHTLSYARTVAFDPSGSGRKDHIAVIGVYADDYMNDNTKAHIYVYVINKDHDCSAMLDLGKASWMSDSHGSLNNDYMWDFNAMNFMQITAGDYDGDGRDSLVVWACGSEPLLKEVYVNSHNGSIRLTLGDDNGYEAVPNDDSWDKYDIKNGKYVYKEDAKGLTHYLYYDTPDQDVDNRLHVALGSGDFNGDGIDDLAVLSYVGRVVLGQQGKWGPYYTPMYSVSYGIKDNKDDITAGKNADKNIAVVDTSSGSSHIAPMAAGLATGDIDGDGRDEVIISGIKHEVAGSYWTNDGKRKAVINNTTTRNAYAEVDKKTLVTAIYRGDDLLMFDKNTGANSWTHGGDGASGGYFTDWGNATTADQSLQQIGVETIAFNGKGNPETLFISGDLFSYNNGKITRIYQPEFFQEVDSGTGTDESLGTKETYIRSMAVGNFDGNDEGHEQIVYVTGEAVSAGTDASQVVYSLGMIGGIYEDEDGNPQPQAMNYYSTKQDAMEDADHYYPKASGTQCTISSCLNYDVCAWDNDSDGLHAKYVGKEYTYTDPAVMAIVQAAPYFEEVKGAMTDMGTSYSITTSYEYSSSQGNSTSFGVGADYELEAEVVKFNVSAGYATDWSESFENSWCDSDTYTVNAIGQDQVLLYRTPVTIYKYQIEKKGEWPEDNILELSFPGKSVIARAKIDDYNEFAEYYNREMKRIAAEMNEEAGEIVIPEDKIPHLSLIKDKYLGNEGNPYAYMSYPTDDVTVLQDSPFESGVGSASTEYGWDREHSTSYEESNSHGFSFEAQLMFQWHATPHTGMALGGHVSLDYMRDYSTSRTETKGIGASCTIGNLDPDALEDYGLTETSAKQYGYTSQLVTWPSDIVLVDSVFETSMESEFEDQFDDPENQKRDLKYVPIFGYLVSNVKSPTPPVTDLESEFRLDENEEMNILLTWSDPSTDYRRVGAYTIYQIQKDGSYTEVATVDADTTEYMFADIDGRNEYKFTVRTRSGPHELYESVNSNITYLYLEANALYSIELTSSDETSDTYTVTHTDGTKTLITVKHGVGVADIRKTSSSEDGLHDTYTIYFTDGTTASFVVTNGKDGRDVELRTYTPEGSNKEIIQWRYVGEKEWHDLVEVSDVAFVEGRKVELQMADGYVQWHYEGDKAWYNLISIEALKGEKGDQGVQGEAGREVELRVNEDGLIQWHYVDEEKWHDLVASSDSKLIEGKPGREVEIRVYNETDPETGDEINEIQWRYVGDEDWQTLIDLGLLKGEEGDDGKQIELMYDEKVNVILWRYEGEDWQELVVLEGDALKGDRGDDGREILLNVDEEEGYVQWKYEGEEEWTNLYKLSDLKGQDAKQIELMYDKKTNTVMWRYEGEEEWNVLFKIPQASDGKDGKDGRGIVSLEKTASIGVVDTYTITYTDGTTSTFTVTNGVSSESENDRYTDKRQNDSSDNNTNNSSKDTDNSSSNTIIYNNTTEKEEVLTSVGITNIKVDSKGNLIITLSDNSSVVVGNTKEKNSLASEKQIEKNGHVESYFFNVPYEDFVSLKIDDNNAADNVYSVTSLGDGVLVTILENAISDSSKLEAVTRDEVISTSVSKRSSSIPTWLLLLFGAWNALLTGGYVVMAKRFAHLKKRIG